MLSSDLEDILRDATGKFTPESAPALLSSILHILRRERSRPLDPDYMSEDACATMLGTRPKIYALLTEAVEDVDCDLLWNCVLAQALMESEYLLSELFTFKGVAPAWAAQTARLVRISRVGSTQALRATAYRSSLSNITRDNAWATDSPAWLQHETKSPFCLSSEFSHADVLFVVRLHDARCIYVALSTLFKNDFVKTTAADVQSRLSKMTPSEESRYPRISHATKTYPATAISYNMYEDS